MTKILIDLDEDLDFNIEILKANLKYGNKSETIIYVLKDYFKNKGGKNDSK